VANWQFDLYLIPRDAPVPIASEDGLDISGIPAKFGLYIQENLVPIFGHPWLMLENWIVYGIESGTRVDLHFDHTDSVEIKVRLDARRNNDAVIDTICSLALHLNCRYFDPQEKKFIEPIRELVLQSINSSRAAKFQNSSVVIPTHSYITLISPLAIDYRHDDVELVLWVNEGFDDDYSFRAALAEIKQFLDFSGVVTITLPIEESYDDFVFGKFVWDARDYSLYYERSLGYIQFSSSSATDIEDLHAILEPLLPVRLEVARYEIEVPTKKWLHFLTKWLSSAKYK
jgi:hypothetical protein